MALLKTLIFTFLVPGSVTILVPYWLLTSRPDPRASLVPSPGQTVHGVVFWLTHNEIDALYSEASVNAYRPEAVSAHLAGGSVIPALCFNLPVSPAIDERNPQYASKLRKLAERIGLPSSYVSSIR